MTIIQHPRRYGGMFLLLIVILLLAIPMKPDNDVWFLLASGRALDVLPSIPMQEPLTLHPGLDFVMEQWLTAYLFWHVHQIFSMTGLLVLVFLVALFTGYCYLRLTMQETASFFLAGLVTLFTMRVLAAFMTTRPQIFSYLLFTLAFLLLENYAKSGRGKKALFIGLPAISMLIINLHAGFFPMLICLILPYLLESFMKDDGPFSRNEHLTGKILLPVLILTIFAALCNPYGTQALTYTTSGIMSGYHASVIREMCPLSIQVEFFPPTILLVALLIFGYIHTPKRIPYRYIFLAGGTFLLTCLMQRGAALFFLFSGFQLAYLFQDIQDADIVRFLKKPFVQFMLVSILLAMVAAKDGDWRSLFLGVPLCLLLLFWNRLPEQEQPRSFFRFLVGSACSILLTFVVLPPTFPMQPDAQGAFRALANRTISPSSIRLYCDYDDGGYAEYLGIRPYIDPRAEVFMLPVNHQKDIFKEWMDVKTGRIYYKDFLARYDFNYLLVRKEDALYYALAQDNHYRMFYDQDGIRVFEKKGEGAEDFAERL